MIPDPKLRALFIRNLPVKTLGQFLAREPWFVADVERVANGELGADALAARFTSYRVSYGRDVMQRVIELAARPFEPMNTQRINLRLTTLVPRRIKLLLTTLVYYAAFEDAELEPIDRQQRWSGNDWREIAADFIVSQGAGNRCLAAGCTTELAADRRSPYLRRLNAPASGHTRYCSSHHRQRQNHNKAMESAAALLEEVGQLLRIPRPARS